MNYLSVNLSLSPFLSSIFNENFMRDDEKFSLPDSFFPPIPEPATNIPALPWVLPVSVVETRTSKSIMV